MSALPDDQALEDAAAGDLVGRFLGIIRCAEQESTLDWIEKIPEMRHRAPEVRAAAQSPSVRVAIKSRRAELHARPARLF